MKTNIKPLSLMLLLALGYSSSNYSMADELASRAGEHSDRIQATAESEGRELTEEENTRLRRLADPRSRAAAVHDEDAFQRAGSPTAETMSPASSFGNLGAEGSVDMFQTPGGEAPEPRSFEEDHPTVARAISKIPIRAVREAVMKRVKMAPTVDPSDVPATTDAKATEALRDAANTAEQDGVSERSFWERVRESTIGSAVGEARQALSDWVDEKMHQMAHFGKTDYNDRRRDMKARHKDIIDKMKEDKKNALSAKKNEQKVELDSMDSEFNRVTNELKASHSTAMKELPEETSPEVKKTIIERHKRSLENLKAQHELKKAGRRVTHAQDLDRVRSEYDTAIQENQGYHADDLAELNRNIRAEVATGRAQDRHVSARTKSWTDEVSRIHRSKKATMDSMKTLHKAQSDELDAQHQQELQGLEGQKMRPSEKRAQRDAMLERHADETYDLDEKQDQERQRAEKMFERRTTRANDSFSTDRDAIRASQDPETTAKRAKAASKIQRALRSRGAGKNVAEAGNFNTPLTRTDSEMI